MRTLVPLLLWLPGAAAGCAAPPGAVLPAAAGPPRAWRLVDGPGGLALERGEDAARIAVEIRFSRPEAATSEVVEAEIRLPGSVGRRRLEVRPARPDVRILGPSELAIDGEGPVRVRFSCGTAGPGGILVLVKD